MNNTDPIIFDTPEGIAFFRLAQLKAVLSLELKGFKMWRNTSAYSQAKRQFGLKGSRQAVYDQLCTMVDEAINGTASSVI